MRIFVIVLILITELQPAYSQGMATPIVTVTSVEKHGVFDIAHLTFPTPAETTDPINALVYAEYFKPKRAAKMPAVIILHHWKASDLQIERQIASLFAESGIASVLIVMPYHMQRTPTGRISGEDMISADIPKTVAVMKQTIQEISALKLWLESLSEIDANRIGIVGISLGALAAARAYGELGGFSAAVLILGGGNAADILWSSPLTLEIKRKLIAKGCDKTRLEQEIAPIEPMACLTPIQGRNALMINAKYDEAIPKRDTLALWNALGRPAIVWIESGHYVPFGREKVAHTAKDFLLYKFGEISSFNPPAEITSRSIDIGLTSDRASLLSPSVFVEITRVGGSGTFGINTSGSGISVAAGLKISRNLKVGAHRRITGKNREVLPFLMLGFAL